MVFAKVDHVSDSTRKKREMENTLSKNKPF
jgi:hypothetical protein